MTALLSHHDKISTFPFRTIATFGLLVSASAWSLSASAANVDLVTNIEPVNASSPAQTFVPYLLNVSFSNISGTATNATGTIVLPANVMAIGLSVASGNAASCPAASSFVPVPTATTAGGETMSATLPQLLSKQACNYVLSVTPTQSGSAYLMRSSMATSAADTEITPRTNSSENPFAVTQSNISLAVDKKITGGATQDASNPTHWNATDYNTPIEFTVTYTNQSAMPLSLGAIGSIWNDWEGTWSPQIVPTGSDGALISCTSSVDGANSPACQALDFSTVSSTAGTNVYAFINRAPTGFTNEVMQAGETITIQYRRSFKPPVCGSPVMANTATWTVTAEDINLQWGGSGADNSALSFSFPYTQSTRGTDCTPVNLNLKADKKLLSVQDKSGATKASNSIEQDGDMAVYELTIDLSQDAQPAGSGRDGIDFNVYDTVLLAQGTMPVAMPANALQLQMEWLSCNDGSGASCIPPNNPIQPYRPYFTPSVSHNVHVKWGTKAVMQIALRFKVDSALQCMLQNDALQNQAAFSVVSVATDGFTFGPSYTQVPLAANLVTTQVNVLPNAPYCVNLTTNKRVTPMLVPDLATPVVFDVQFSNNTAQDGPKTVRQAQAKDILGADFKASAASCRVSAGVATVPAGSLLGTISGADNTMQFPITNMERGAVVNCSITGNLLRSGSFQNTAAIALVGMPSKALLNDGVTEVAVQDVMPADDVAIVNYMTAGATPEPNTPTPVPSNTPWGIALLAAALAALAWRHRGAGHR